MVMGGDSRHEGCGFEYRYCTILDRHFFIFDYFYKLVTCLFVEEAKINK